ncbi:MAG TPA: hypothetical protein VLL76_04345, partial [Candidatus Omnitrophota bacterium]|nr:hypothetical protein [Candidatus Omnitrophota bacterium]
ERTRVVDEARAKLFELQTKEQELLGKYHEGSVFVQRVQGERRKVQSLLDQMLTTSDTRVTQGTNQVHQEIEKELFRAEAGLTTARSRSKTLARQLADIDRRLETINGAERLEAAARAAETALGDHKGSAVDAIGVVQAAAAGSRPVGPGRAGIVAIAAAIGAVLAVALAALAQRLSSRFSTPADVERRLGLPVLTTIPRES